MLNVPAIMEALNAVPLCQASLISWQLKTPEGWGTASVYRCTDPENKQRARFCAVGALLHGIGVSDEQIELETSNCTALMYRYGDRLYEKYGIESAEQLERIIDANDSGQASDDDITIHARVIHATEEMNTEMLWGEAKFLAGRAVR